MNGFDESAEIIGFAADRSGVLRINKSDADRPFDFSIKAQGEVLSIEVTPKGSSETQIYTGSHFATIIGSGFEDSFTLMERGADESTRILIDGGAGYDRLIGSAGLGQGDGSAVVDIRNGVYTLNGVVTARNVESVWLSAGRDPLLRLSGDVSSRPLEFYHQASGSAYSSVDFDLSHSRRGIAVGTYGGIFDHSESTNFFSLDVNDHADLDIDVDRTTRIDITGSIHDDLFYLGFVDPRFYNSTSVAYDGGGGIDTLSISYEEEYISDYVPNVQFLVNRNGSITSPYGSFFNFERYEITAVYDGYVVTGSRNDTVRGTGEFHGMGGDDVLDGSDDYYGQLYSSLDGGNGDDRLIGGDIGNRLTGGNGDDRLSGGAGDDLFDGGKGLDIVSFEGASKGVIVDLSISDQQATGDGTDTLIGIEGLVGSRYDDTLRGSARNDVIAGAGGDNLLDGGAGFDLASYAGSYYGVIVDLARTDAQAVSSYATDTLIGFEGLIGSDRDDTLLGDSGDNLLEGGGGNDRTNGRDGTDTASYAGAVAGVNVNLSLTIGQDTRGAGTDTLSNIENLFGSGFDDVLSGGTGDNRLDGGTGYDTVSYADAIGEMIVDLSTGRATGDGSDTLRRFEGVIGSANNDLLTGDADDNTIEGGRGNDAIDGGGGSDIASYTGAEAGVRVDLALAGIQKTTGAGRDTLTNVEGLTGSGFNDELAGNAASNVLSGGQGDDRLSGRDGDDRLIGESGSDRLIGGDGIDTAVYLTGAASDYVVVARNGGYSVTSADGVDTLLGVERIEIAGRVLDLSGLAEQPLHSPPDLATGLG